jgi:DNA-binding FrmR family transcriptional regulator
MEISQDVKDDLHRRLRRIEGQVRGIQGMITDERECRDIVTQIAAVTKAIEQVGFKMLASGMASCLENPEKSAAEGYSIDEVEKMFLKLA